MRVTRENERAIREERRVLDGVIYVYKLLLNEGVRYSTIGIPLDSIEVEMENIKDGKLTNARAGELFSEEKKANAFFEKLVRNLATPIDLCYIVEDEFK